MIQDPKFIFLVDPSVGDDFNHDLHEAVMQVPRANVPDLSPNQIAFIQKTGYVLEDQILRPCWVGVVAEWWSTLILIGQSLSDDPSLIKSDSWQKFRSTLLR